MRAGLALALLIGIAGCERLGDAVVERGLSRADAALLRSPDLTVVLCGTGSPLADASRAGACTAIVAGGQLLLVDVGPGAWESADLAGLPVAELSGILLTHFHSDHIGDLGEAMTQSWIGGRRAPLSVHGPPGTARVVAGMVEAYAQDADARAALHGAEHMPRAAAAAVAHEVAPPDDPAAAATVLDRDGLRVRMFRVDHPSVEMAVGYRFDFRGRAVVISGDTTAATALARHAHGADILIHEALQPDLVDRVGRVARRTGRSRLADMLDDGLTYHTSPRDAAVVAERAGVRTLVLSHLIPSPNNVLLRRQFVAGLAEVFGGEVVVGRDGQRFSLPPAGG